MPIAPDPIAERIAGSGPTVGANAQDLAQYGVLVLRSRGIPSITGGDEQHALWVEQQPTAVMANAGRDACQDRFGSPQATARQTEADDTIVASSGDMCEQCLLIVWRKSDAHQPALAKTGRCDDSGNVAHRADLAPFRDPHYPARVPLGDERLAGTQEGDPPRNVEVVGNDAGDLRSRSCGPRR